MDVFFNFLDRITVWHISSMLFFGVCFFLVKLLFDFHKTETVQLYDIIVQNGSTNRVSLTKLMQLAGALTSTWIVVHLTLLDKLSFEIFGIYLAYVSGSEAYSKYLKVKSAASQKVEDPEA